MSIKDYEQAIVFAAKNGNEKSFEELYKIYYQKVFLLAKATLKNEADAEDVLQQTFISAWKNIAALEDNGAFNTWIQRITLNQCYSLLRKSKPTLSVNDEDDDGGVMELESDLQLPEVYAQQADLKERLGKIILQLSEVQRQTIQLFYYDEMSVEKIAQVMDCSVGTVKSRLFLARKAIRTEIEETERKTGTKFYGIAGIPMLPFGRLFASQAEAASMQASSAIRSYSKISAEVFGAAKRIAFESANKIAKAGERTISKSVASIAKKSAKKAAASAAGQIGTRIAAAAASASILCGSVLGGFSDAAAAKVTLPDNISILAEKSEPDATDAYLAYIDLLNEKKENIEKYTWQKGHFGNDEYWITDEPKPVVFADVYGDDTPELIYVSTDVLYTAESNLHIVTYERGVTSELYNAKWDYVAGGGFYYGLFKCDMNNSIYGYTSTGDEGWTIEYFQLVEEGKKLIKKSLLRYDTYPDQESIARGEYTKIEEYTYNEKTIDQSSYDIKENEILDRITSVLMCSARSLPENISFFATQNGCPAMTCSEAILYLKNQIGDSYTLKSRDVPDSLKWFLLQFNFGYGNQEFDSQYPINDSQYQNIIYRIMTNGSCSMNLIYPGSVSEEHWDDGTIDPKGKYKQNGHCSFLVSDVEKAKWIAKNIFHISDENISEAIEYGEENGLFYIQNEKAYLKLDGIGDPGCKINFESVTFDGSIYHVIYTHYIEDAYAESAKTFCAELEYKEINDCHYWSLFKQSEYVPETVYPEDAGIDASQYLGTWENENDQLFIRSAYGKTVVFSYAFYRRYRSEEITAVLSGNTATFSGKEDGCLTFSDNSITLHLNKIPVEIIKSTSTNEFTYKKTDWKSIYSWFVQGYEFMRWGNEDYGTETDFLFGLYDIDQDGTPELLIHNGYMARTQRCAYCYTVEDDHIAYAGICPTEAYYINDNSFPGLIGRYSDSSEAFWNYYSKSGSTVSSEHVYTETSSFDGSSIRQETKNNELFKACSGEKIFFDKLFTIDQINEMGWDQFVSGFDKEADLSPACNEAVPLPINFTADQTIDLQWGWNLFGKDASEYDHNIAMTALVLSQAAESGESEIMARYKDLGFENLKTVYYSGRDDNMDMPASCFASSKAELNGTTKYVVSITVRGTGDGGDILTDIGSVIYGFNTAANNVKNNFKSYYDSLSDFYHDNVTPDNTIMFITGHSLGGAVAGQLGQMLEGICAHRNHIFDYTFASPNYQTFEYDTESFTNIHNIINIQDLVPAVPWGYGKYGHCWYYDACDNGISQYLQKTYSEEEWKDIQKGINDKTLIFVGAINSAKTNIVTHHLCQTYMACMLKGVPSNIGNGAKSAYSLSSIHCPVDIQILDTNGNLAAWTIADKVYYADGANLLILVDQDEKYVCVPGGIEYNILFTGTDTGAMSYTQQTFSNGENVSEKSFENVAIEAGKLLYANVNSENVSAQELNVIDNSGRIKKEVKGTGEEKTSFSFNKTGWLFLCLDVISGASLLISLFSIIKSVKVKKDTALLEAK